MGGILPKVACSFLLPAPNQGLCFSRTPQTGGQPQGQHRGKPQQKLRLEFSNSSFATRNNRLKLNLGLTVLINFYLGALILSMNRMNLSELVKMTEINYAQKFAKYLKVLRGEI